SEELEIWLNDLIFNKSSELIKTVSISALNGVKILWNSIIGFIISVYLLAGKERFAAQAKKILYALFSNNTANIVINNFRFTNKTFTGFLSGKIVDSILIGMFCFIGTSLMHTPYAALISVIIGVTNVIPFFGPYLGAIPSIILVFIVDPMHPLKCVYFALFVLLLQQFDGNVLGPKILGDSTGLTGFWVIFAITFFGGLFSIFGMIIGVPIFAVIYAAVKSFINVKLVKKNLSIQTEDYKDVGAIDESGYHEYIPDYRLAKNERNQSFYGSHFFSNSFDMQNQLKIFIAEKQAIQENITEDAVDASDLGQKSSKKEES
ncbi:MAG: AI-2E family transporter, partial [Lachnospiraceae bacterium]|nr:AI-2E family transporter [Lachnospiraceae bacterium]